MVTDPSGSRTLPLRAVILSIAALLVPVLSSAAFPEWTEQQGVLIWLTALIPAFLMAFYKGWTGAAHALAAGMAVLSITNAIVIAIGWASPDWPLLMGIVVVLIVTTLSIGWLAELLHRERRRAEMQALTDPLTELPNRRYAELFLDTAFAASERGRPLAVALFDIDHFKSVNDQYGHQVGDEVLKALAGVLRRITRRSDLAARIGGEEFLCVLTDGDLEGAVVLANKVREAFRSLELPWGSFTISAGVAVPVPGMGSPDLLVAEADRALYRAKESGRDRVVAVRPARSALEAPASGSASKDGSPRYETRKILVVDDDPAVLRMVERLLVDAGASVLSAGSGQAGLALVAERGPVDLVVADVMMPGMSGFTMVDRLEELGHEVAVIFMSGFLQSSVSWDGAPGRRVAFVQKPLDPDALIAKIDEMLTELGKSASAGEGKWASTSSGEDPDGLPATISEGGT